jgi:hypothetical protein
MTQIQTYTGKRIDVANPSHLDICIEDIAHALACIPRFAGHTKQFYSVAQHSLHVASLVPEHLRLAALLHDAAEAYMLDMMTPIKAQLPEYQRMYDLVEWEVGGAFVVHATHFHCDAVKQADQIALATEVRDLMEPVDWWAPTAEPDINHITQCLLPPEAERAFLKAYEKATR